MEEPIKDLKPPIVETTPETNTSLYVAISGVFIVAAIVFTGKGWYTVYDNSYSAQIVGGDAYNFIIYATRGTALICIGIVCAVLSVTFSVFANIANKTQRSNAFKSASDA